MRYARKLHILIVAAVESMIVSARCPDRLMLFVEG
jgi:hypothetical protein